MRLLYSLTGEMHTLVRTEYNQLSVLWETAMSGLEDGKG